MDAANKMKYLIILISFIFFSSCTLDENENPPNSDLRGIVVDSDGHPIENAKIILSFDTEVDPARPYLYVTYHLDDYGSVLVWVEHDCHDTVIVLADHTLFSGTYTSTWDYFDKDGMLPVEGYHNVHIQTENETISHEFYIEKFYPNIYNGLNEAYGSMKAFVLTDNNGEFTVSPECMPFPQREQEMVDAEGNAIGSSWNPVSRFIEVIIIHPDYTHAIIDSVFLDELEGADMEAVLTEILH